MTFRGPIMPFALPPGSRPWRGIVIHHSATPDGITNNWDAIRRYHTSWRIDGEIVAREEYERRKTIGQGKRFEPSWKDIGYHCGAERVGGNLQLCWGRSLAMAGAHAGVAGVSNRFNEDSIGLCAVGDFDKAPPDPELWNFCLCLARGLVSAFNIAPACVLGHREVYAALGVPEQKSCPGRYWSMSTFREEI